MYWDPHGRQAVEQPRDEALEILRTVEENLGEEYKKRSREEGLADLREQLETQMKEAREKYTTWNELRALLREHLGLDRYSERKREALLAEEDAERLGTTYADPRSDRDIERHQGGRKTGLGRALRADAEVVVAGVHVMVIAADDISTLAATGGLLKHGIKEGTELLLRKSDGGLELYKVIDGKAVQQVLDETARKRLRKELGEAGEVVAKETGAPGEAAEKIVSRTTRAGES